MPYHHLFFSRPSDAAPRHAGPRRKGPTPRRDMQSRRCRFERLEDRTLLATDLTVTIGSAAVQSKPQEAASQYIDIIMDVADGVEDWLSAYGGTIVISGGSGISLTGVAQASNPVFPGQTPSTYSSTATTLNVSDYLSTPHAEKLITDGAGLFRVTYTVAADTEGTFTLSFTSLEMYDGDNVAIENVELVAGTITVTRTPSLSVENVTVTETDTGTATANFTISLSTASPEIVTVHYATADGTALSGADYEAISGDLTFLAGETSKTVSVAVLGDTLYELTEAFSLELSAATNATLAKASATATIVDQDGAPSLFVDDIVVAEGSDGAATATFTVRLSAATGTTVTVSFTTADGTALVNRDYLSASGELAFAPGETAKTVAVSVLGDTVDEHDETFLLILSNPSHATLGDGQAQATILDDDLPPSLSINDLSLVEGDANNGEITFTVTLSAASEKTITVNYATENGTALAGSDYEAVSGSITFAPGETTQTIRVVVFADTLGEDDEVFLVNLTNAAEASIARATGTVTIEDDDLPNYVVRLAYLVAADRGADPHATAGIQYAAIQAQAWFAEQMDRYGLGSLTFALETTSDGVTPVVHVVYLDEAASYYNPAPWTTLQAAASEAGLSIGAEGQVWLLVYDGLVMNADGSLQGQVGLGASTGSGSDAGVGIVSYHALMTSDYLFNDASYDGVLVTELGDVPMKAGVTAASYEGTTLSSVSAANYGILLHELGHALGLSHDFRNDENYSGDLMGNGLRGLRGWIDPVRYPDDDLRLSYAEALTLSVSRYFHSETTYTDDVTPTASVSLSETAVPVDGQLSFSFTASDSHQLAAAVLLLKKTDNTGDCQTQVVAELALAGTTVSSVIQTSYYTSGTTNTYVLCVYDTAGNRLDREFTVTVATGDNQAPQVSLCVANSQVTVGQHVELDAAGTVDRDGTVLVYEWDLNGDGTYEVSTGTTATCTTTFATEGVYQVRVRVTDASGAQSVSEPLAFRVDALPTLTVQGTSIAETDGSTTIGFTLTLSKAATKLITLNYATADGTALAGSDYMACAGSITFLPGETSKTVSVPVLGDAIAEPEETFLLTVFNVAGAAATSSQATGTITNDDDPAAPVVTTTADTLAYNENAAATAVDPGLQLTDADSATLSGATVAITAGYQAGQDQLGFTDQDGIQGNWNADTGTLTLTGSASLASYLAALQSVTYRNLSENPNTFVRTVSVTVSDGGLTSDVASRSITVTSLNDGPVLTVPASFSAVEDTSLAITGISIADVDAGDASIQVTLSVLHGTLTVASSVTDGVTSASLSGNGTSSVTITATLAQINATLANSQGLLYLPATDYTGSDTLTVTVADQSATGSGGSLTDTETAGINVAHLNVAPTVSVGSTATTPEDTGLAITGISIADVDAGEAAIQVTLSVLHGTLTVASDVPDGVPSANLSGNGTSSVTITATLAQINATLAEAQGLVYLPAANYSGSDTLTILADDQGASGSGGNQSTTQILTLTVTSVNDAPQVTAAASQVTYTGTALSLTGISITDVDAGDASIQVTLAVQHGILTMSSNVTGGVSSTNLANNGTSYVVITGTRAQINATLADSAGLRYLSAADYAGSDTLTITVNDQGNSGTGAPQTATGTVTITVHALGRISGFVYRDANGSGSPSSGEGIALVKITLTNVSTNAQQVAWTDADGWYEFTDLTSGQYTVAEQQPAAFLDGGANQATVSLTGDGAHQTVNFREWGIRPQYALLRFLVSSSQSTGVQQTLLHQAIVSAETAAGRTDPTPALDEPQIAQSDSVVTIQLTSDTNNVHIVAGSATHTVTINGEDYQYAAANVTKIVVIGGLGEDSVTITATGESQAALTAKSATLVAAAYSIQVCCMEQISIVGNSSSSATLYDSQVDDLLNNKKASAQASAFFYTNEASGFGKIVGISDSGGLDTLTTAASLDYVLTTEGDWHSL